MGYFGKHAGAYHGAYFGSVGGAAPAVLAPLTTTWPAIRDYWLTLLGALSPTLLPSFRFREWEANQSDFAAWAEATGGEAFRVFHIEHDFDYGDGGRFLNSAANSIVHTATVLVCYPNQRDLFGKRTDAIIDQDQHDITRTLGLRAWANYYANVSRGQCGIFRIGTFAAGGQAAKVAGIRFQLEYDRTIP